MTYREKFNTCKSWKCKVQVLNLFHQYMCLRHKRWGMRQTAKYFNVSLGLVSENIELGNNWDRIKYIESRAKAIKYLKENGV